MGGGGWPLSALCKHTPLQLVWEFTVPTHTLVILSYYLLSTYVPGSLGIAEHRLCSWMRLKWSWFIASPLQWARQKAGESVRVILVDYDGNLLKKMMCGLE